MHERVKLLVQLVLEEEDRENTPVVQGEVFVSLCECDVEHLPGVSRKGVLEK